MTTLIIGFLIETVFNFVIIDSFSGADIFIVFVYWEILSIIFQSVASVLLIQ